MPGYEPFLLCDFHVHTRWSDGRLSVREVIETADLTDSAAARARLAECGHAPDTAGGYRPGWV